MTTTPMLAASATIHTKTVPSLTPQQVQAQAQNTVAALPHMTEEAVIATARNASLLATCAYIIRGACASELLGRLPKLKGGRGKKDAEGQGRKAYLVRLAGQFGVEGRTLHDDLRIYERFFADDKASSDQDAGGEEAALMRYGGLRRDHFRAALSAPDPLKVIEAASTQAQSGGCSVRALRADVQAGKAVGRRVGSLVFEAGDALPTNPLCACNPLPSSAVDAATVRWEDALGEEAVAALQTLAARHNAVHPTDLLDAVGYVRRLIMQAAREAGADLLSTTDAALSVTEVSGATSSMPVTASTREDLVFA